MNSIFLIGPMGAGKSTVGQALAQLCGWPFYDSDQLIEEATQLSIATLFMREGEPQFRALEAAMIQKIWEYRPIVLATGGGAVLWPSTAANLRAHGTVVYLQVSLKTQWQRLRRQAGKRPLFRGAMQLAALQTERAPRYAALADWCVPTDHERPEDLAQSIWKTAQCYIRP